MKQIKLSEKRIILLIILASGILLMILSNGSYDKTPAPADSALVLEEKIAALVEKTYRIKDVSVILTYDTYGEKITAPDTSETGSVFGSGNSQPFVISEKLPYVRGVLISAKNITFEKSVEIQKAVATLLGINSSKVNVIYSD